MDLPFYAVIMAGGGGTRLWPASRLRQPKQLLPLLGGRSLFRIAVERLQPLFLPDRTLIVTNAELLPTLRREAPQLPAANFLCEPEPRSTAPAIMLAVAALQQREPQLVMACLTADHYIRDEGALRSLLQAAYAAASAGHLVTLGITPTAPITGFGYIERGEPAGAFGGHPAYHVRAFREKPSLEVAASYVADGNHLWNSGMFVWSIARIKEEFARQMPEVAASARALSALLGRSGGEAEISRLWTGIPARSLDYGIMEGAKDALVFPASDLGWADVGTWDSLLDIYARDPDLRVRDKVIHLDVDSSDVDVFNLGGGTRAIATVGLEGVVIVQTADAILVCARGRSQEVRRLVDQLKKRDDTRPLL